jgi:hypothetical protein
MLLKALAAKLFPSSTHRPSWRAHSPSSGVSNPELARHRHLHNDVATPARTRCYITPIGEVGEIVSTAREN